ncbi:MAG: glycine--tRNA ligase subunit beta [Enterobacterales bacterium]
MKNSTFLFEIGTEEMPYKSQCILHKSFVLNIKIKLKNFKIKYDKLFYFSTSRRFAIKICNIYQSKIDIKFFKLKFNNLKELLYKSIIFSLKKIKFLKTMKWNSNFAEFIRPVTSITMLLDDEIIQCKIFNINANRFIYGHRFLGKNIITLNHAHQYPDILEKNNFVIANFDKRKEKIICDIHRITTNINGIADLDQRLLKEIAYLVEYPVVLLGKFKKRFLSIPREILICIMKNYQKYFPIYDLNNNLLPYFIFVSNIISNNMKNIIHDNEQVINSRMQDAEFLINIDCKYKLIDRLENLKKVLFQKHLGSMYEKTFRIKKLSAWIANQIGANIKYTERAALLSKCDLTTNIVCEFTEIQGVIGMYYSMYNKEIYDISLAQKEQYYPRFSNDILPTTLISSALSIADKIDTLVGMFGINKNSVTKNDPFYLRRLTIGIIRILINKKLNIDLKDLIKLAISLYKNKLTNILTENNIIKFIFDRLIFFYINKGYNIDEINSILSISKTKLIDFEEKIISVSFLCKLKESKLLISTNRRISNILKKCNYDTSYIFNMSILVNPYEIKLLNFINLLYKKIKSLLNKKCYKDIFLEFIFISKYIENFFKHVMIMVSNNDTRNNRLFLLNKIHNIFLCIADISLLKTKL